MFYNSVSFDCEQQEQRDQSYKCLYEQERESQHKLLKTSLFIHFNMVIQHVFDLKVLILNGE